MVSEHTRQSTLTHITHDWTKSFSRQARRTLPPEISWLMAQALEVPDIISLAVGFVDGESLPNEELGCILQDMMRQTNAGQAALQYGTTQGDLELREALIHRLQNEGVFHSDSRIGASNCLVGSGSQQILYLAAEALLDEGDIVLLEAPTYFVVLGVFNSRGARTVGIDTDEGGLIPEKLEERLEELKRQGLLQRVKMLYLMTYATNPLGVTLSQKRREQIQSILMRYREEGYPILLLEDAAYRRLIFDGDCPPPIKSFDEENDWVLYTESISKSLSPGLRLGFAAGPQALIDKMIDLKGNHDFGSSNLAQQILKEVMRTGLFERHLQTLNAVYRRKRNLALQVLRDHFPSQARWLQTNGGFYIWVSLPAGVDTGARGDLFKTALEEKILYVPGCLCYSADRPEAQRSSSMRLSFGMIGEERLQEGCKRLGKTLKRFL